MHECMYATTQDHALSLRAYAFAGSFVAFICNHIRYIFNFNFRFTNYLISPTHFRRE